MITDLIFFKPSLKVAFEGQIVGSLSYFVRETIPVVGGFNREDCFTKHTTSEWYLTVPSGSCSSCSTTTIPPTYELFQWWWCESVLFLSTKSTVDLVD